MLAGRRFTIRSTLPPEQVRSRLREAIGAPRTSPFERTREPFTGKLSGSSFDFVRTYHGRNSVRPRIRGSIVAGVNGTSVQGTMRIHELVMVFLAFVLLGPGLFLARIWVSGVRSGTFNPFLLVFPGGVALLLVAFGAGFRHESRRALAMLAEIVEADRSEFE